MALYFCEIAATDDWTANGVEIVRPDLVGKDAPGTARRRLSLQAYRVIPLISRHGMGASNRLHARQSLQARGKVLVILLRARRVVASGSHVDAQEKCLLRIETRIGRHRATESAQQQSGRDEQQ